MSERELKSVGELERVDVAEAVLDVRVDDELGETEDLATEVEGVSEARLFALLGRERLDGLEAAGGMALVAVFVRSGYRKLGREGAKREIKRTSCCSRDGGS